MIITIDHLSGLIDGAALAARTTWLEDAAGILPELDATSAAPAKITGDLAQTSVTSTVAFVGSTTTGSASVTVVSAAGLAVGQSVTGAGIPALTTILTIAGTTVTLSANATATAAAAALTATVEQQVLGLSDWTIDFKLKTADSTTTDDGEWDSSLPSTKSWTVKAKFMFIDSDGSQNDQILAAISGASNAQPWNFFPTIAVGRSGFTGLAYVDGITIAAGRGKVVGLDVSLKGTGPLTPITQLTPVSTTTTTGLQAED